ncbi:hypothetical protein O181_010438 [Austropuccinia psidii MF-1]|uniref:endopeptidase La n=1 Tax=Austropuccinia psidii MF-1 TaxID=1389203 RepID=A0A9Q3GKD1_9BASI|nr:hypothetical protein [Austropuccinia psidii MF-1]
MLNDKDLLIICLLDLSNQQHHQDSILSKRQINNNDNDNDHHIHIISDFNHHNDNHHHSKSISSPKFYDWGCLAKSKIDFASTSSLFSPNSLIERIHLYDEINLDQTNPSESNNLLIKFKLITLNFLFTLNNHFNHHQKESNLKIFKLLNSLKLNDLSHFIDLLIYQIILIPWLEKVKFSSYYNLKLKIEKSLELFINLTLKFKSPANSLIYQINPIHHNPTNNNNNNNNSHLNFINSISSLNQLQKNLLINHYLNQLNRNPKSSNTFFSFDSNPSNLNHSSFINFNKSNHSNFLSSNLEHQNDELQQLENKINSAGMLKEAHQISIKELKRLTSTPPNSLDYSIIKNYLEIMLELPWSKSSSSQNQSILNHDFLEKSKNQLDSDHYGMIKVKRRILEFLSVIKLRKNLELSSSPIQPAEIQNQNNSFNQADLQNTLINNLNSNLLINPSSIISHQFNSSHSSDLKKKPSPILLLVGPPGVGKTSIAKSIAKALNKKFYRISLGGVKDECEIRGHRRTYVGSMPGLIVQALRRVGVNDPVILLDEIDKVGGQSINGDPSAALLEVLDPEQNSSFVDHYINTPIDLSTVTFLATANTTQTISPPLLDRLEMIELEGYLLDEKLNIAKRNLIPKQIENYSLSSTHFILDDDEIIKRLILFYTKESGVRGLEREIGSLCRAKVLEWIEYQEKIQNSKQQIDRFDPKIHFEDLHRILGPEKYEIELSNIKLKAGVAIGMAYQASGNGSLLYIESTWYPGKGHLKLTGSLGEVIKESAELAISWIKAHGEKMDLITKFDEMDFHIHFPSGSVKKDGPSAGVGLVLSLVSLLSQIPIDNCLAVTGEISLRGQVLAVGGIREKVLAAHRSGIKEIILPIKNQKEIEADEHLAAIKEKIKINYVNSLAQVIKLVFKDQLWKKTNDQELIKNKPVGLMKEIQKKDENLLLLNDEKDEIEKKKQGFERLIQMVDSLL